MKRGTTRHPKMQEFIRVLDQRPRSLARAVGYLELLFHFTAEFAPQGDIGKYPVSRIEAAMDWTGESGRLIDALKQSGWVDEIPVSDPLVTPQSTLSHPVVTPQSPRSLLVVHDWHDHCDEVVRRKLQRAGLSFLSVRDYLTAIRPSVTDIPTNSVRLPLPLPKPIPEPIPRPLPDPAASHVLVGKPEWKQDAIFAQFAADYLTSGGAFIDEDFLEAFQWCWKKLDWEQKKLRIDSLKIRLTYWDEPSFVPKPRKFLEQEWKRPLPAPTKSRQQRSADEWKDA